MIYRFDTEKEVSLSQVGGKAKSLIQSTKAGFAVPDGFVLSVDFFGEWVEIVKSNKVWTDFLASPTREKCDHVKAFASTMKLSNSQKQALDKEIKQFGEDVIFAVRSSSPEEDLAGTSFAGGYETTLGITIDNLENAIITSFISMFDTRIVEYKKQNNMAIDNPKIAVVVQKQIASEMSGVAFSISPFNNCYDECVINANFGLGETVVAGEITPDTYIVDKIGHKIIDTKIGDKAYSLWLSKDGGTYKKGNENSSRHCLSQSQILEVANLAKKCEDYYGIPMDIEWAIENNTLYLLQARPITTYFPLFDELITKPGEQKYLYIDSTILTQGFNESFSVLGLEIWAYLIRALKGEFIPEGLDGISLNLHGRQLMHVSHMFKGFGKAATQKSLSTYDTPTKLIFEQMNIQEYIPDYTNKKLKSIKPAMFKYAMGIMGPSIKGYFNTSEAVENYIRISDNIMEEWKKEFEKELDFDALVENCFVHFKSVMHAVGTLVAPMLARPQLTKMFKGKGVDEYLVALSMDLKGNPTSDMGHMMYEIATYPEIQNTDTGKEFESKLQNGEFSTEFTNLFNEFIGKYGCRGAKEIDIETPRPYENMEEFFIQFKQINIDNNAIKTVKERKEEAYNKLLEKATEMGKVKKFKKLTQTLNEGAGYREQPKYLYVILVDMLRKHALEIGEEFVNQGRLQAKKEIFNLTVDEIGNAQRDKLLNLEKLIEKNTTPYNNHISDWPQVFDSRGKVFRAIRKGEDGDIVGDPISPGVVRGVAKVLDSPYEKQLNPGDILIAKATEPSWTPVFINAVAVVLEIGGPLQHGAIIAREYGIPCVSGIDRATTVIKDGDILEVDGTSGIVKVINQ